jgi:hypothetical protein
MNEYRATPFGGTFLTCLSHCLLPHLRTWAYLQSTLVDICLPLMLLSQGNLLWPHVVNIPRVYVLQYLAVDDALSLFADTFLDG